MKKTFGILAAVVVMSILSVTAKADPVIGQVDTFQTGPLGWLVGFGPGPEPRTPLTTLSGGPATTTCSSPAPECASRSAASRPSTTRSGPATTSPRVSTPSRWT